MDSTAEQSRIGTVSPTLYDIVPATGGAYYIQNTWILDASRPVHIGVRQDIILGP